MTDETKQILYTWLDMKYESYNKLEIDNLIYLYYDTKAYIDIMINKNYRKIYYELDIFYEFYYIIPIQLYEFEDIMIDWIENTLNLKGYSIQYGINFKTAWLTPYLK